VPISLNSSSNKQNHLASHPPGQAKVVIGTWNQWKFTMEKRFQTNVFSFFTI